MNLAVDLDGTLLVCETRQSACLHAIARSYALDLNVEKVWTLKRQGRSTRAALLTLGCSEDLSNVLTERWRREIEEPYWLSLDRPFADTHATLSRLVASGSEISLLTARRRADLLAIQLRNLGLPGFFRDIHVVDVAAPRAGKANILARGGFEAFVGDTESDLEAARDAGVPFHAVACGQRDEARLKQAGASEVHACFAEAVDSIVHAQANFDGETAAAGNGPPA